MDDFIEGLVEKCGLSEEQAKKVAQYITDNSDKIGEWFSGVDSVDDVKELVSGKFKSFF